MACHPPRISTPPRRSKHSIECFLWFPICSPPFRYISFFFVSNLSSSPFESSNPFLQHFYCVHPVAIVNVGSCLARPVRVRFLLLRHSAHQQSTRNHSPYAIQSSTNTDYTIFESLTTNPFVGLYASPTDRFHRLTHSNHRSYGVKESSWMDGWRKERRRRQYDTRREWTHGNDLSHSLQDSNRSISYS